MFFNWFKEHNHLFKNVELDLELIDAFETDCLSDTSKFESITKGNDQEICDNMSVEEENVQEIFFRDDKNESFELTEHKDAHVTNTQTSMFMNKYCENIDMPTIVNKVADMINTYEIANKISLNNEDDFEQDEECITEEEFRTKVNSMFECKETRAFPLSASLFP